MSNVSLVIPNWNGKSLMEKNISFWLLAKKDKVNKIDEIIIVDDGSSDDSVKFLRQNYIAEVKLVCHRVNRGFSAAVNTGFRSAKNPIVALINTDVIPDANFLEHILPHFKDKKVFGVSMHEKGYGFARGAFFDGYIIHKPGKELNHSVNSFWVSGGSSVLNRKLWMQLGGFDEQLFSPFYWEDVDVSYRAQKRGFKVLWEPKAQVVHQHEAVINRSNFKMWRVSLIKERNYLLFNWKNLTSSNLMRKHIKGLFKKLRLHPGYIKIIFLAGVKLPSVIKARSKERRESTVSDEAIFAKFN